MVSTEIELLKGRLKELLYLANELGELKVSPQVDYTTAGLQKFAESLAQARAYSERAAEINARAIRLVANAKMLYAYIVERYQDTYDRIVVEQSHKYGDRSWEERASLYRVKCLSTLAEFREGQRYLDQCIAYVEEIAELARSLYRSRGDLLAIVDTMKFGLTIGEGRGD